MIKVILSEKERQFIYTMCFDYYANLGQGLIMRNGKKISENELRRLAKKLGF